MDTLMKVANVAAVEIDMLPDALARKAAMLADAKLIESVSDAFTLDTATEALKAISALIRDVEACRKTVKAPVLDLGKRIDAKAAEYCAELNTEKARIGQLIAAYELTVRRKREEEERRMRAEQARIQAEAAAAYETAQTDEARAAVLDSAKEQLASAKSQAVIDPRPKGLKLRTTLKFEVVDEKALHAARPDLFSPDETKIRAALKLTKDIPGLNVWEETKPII